MAVRRLLTVGLWLCVTTLATAVVWAGTSTVAADLTDRPAPVVAHRDVVEALQPGSSAADTTPGISPPQVGAAAQPPSEAEGSASPSAAPATPPSAAGPSPDPVPDVVPPPPVPPPTTLPPTPPTTGQPSGPTATYSSAGGVVRVACTASSSSCSRPRRTTATGSA